MCKSKIFFLCLLPIFAFCSPAVSSKKQYILKGRPVGLFSNFYTVLSCLDAFEKNKVAFKIDFQNGIYSDEKFCSSNWWNYYFLPIDKTLPGVPLLAITPEMESKLSWRSKLFMDDEYKNYLIKKYIQIKPDVLDIVDRLHRDLFNNSLIIGVHFRNSDKLARDKACLNHKEKILHHLSKVVEEFENSDYKIFVATDDIEFLEEAKKKYPQRIVYCNHLRTSGSIGLHKLYKNYTQGLEAVVDCLLLAKADVLIRGESNLSEIAGIWNPCPRIIVVDERTPNYKKNAAKYKNIGLI